MFEDKNMFSAEADSIFFFLMFYMFTTYKNSMIKLNWRTVLVISNPYSIHHIKLNKLNSNWIDFNCF